jgi:hypothetical protein
VRGRLGYSGGEVAEAGARVNGEETGRAVVGGDRAGEGMGGTRDLTSGPGLSAGERRKRERGGAGDRWGWAVRRNAGTGVAGLLGPREERGGSGRGMGRIRPSRGGEGFFSFFFFYFLFSISHFYFLFLFSFYLLFL